MGTVRALAAIALVAACLSRTTPAGADPLPAGARRADPRLERPVTFQADRVRVADLLARLAEQTGVALSAGTNGDGAGDEVVTVAFRSLQLAEALDALWSLFSHQGGEWHWLRDGALGSPRYRLLRPRAAQLLPFRLKQLTESIWWEHVEKMRAAVRLSPEALQEAARSDPVLRACFPTPNTRMERGLRLFFTHFTEEQQREILAGKRQPTVPIRDLGQPGLEMVRLLWDRALPTRAGDYSALPESAEFYVGVRPGSTPTMFIQFGDLGGYGYLGGLVVRGEWAERLRALWLMRGDSLESDLAEAVVPRQTRPAPTEPLMVLDRLRELSEDAPLSLLAWSVPSIPPKQVNPHEPGSPGGKKLSEFLTILSKTPFYSVHKWRGRVLLLNELMWFEGAARGETVPFAEIVELRRQAEEGNGFLSLRNLARAAGRLSDVQLYSLRGEFDALAHVARWHPIFRLMDHPVRFAGLTSARGLSLRGLTQQLRTLSDPRFEPFLAGGEARALRVTEAPGTKGARQVTLVLLGSGDKVLATSGFSFGPRKPPDSRARP